MRKEYSAVYVKQGKWYVAYVKEVPGANTQGRTLKEAKENLKEALELILETNEKLTRQKILGGQVFEEPIAVTVAS